MQLIAQINTAPWFKTANGETESAGAVSEEAAGPGGGLCPHPSRCSAGCGVPAAAWGRVPRSPRAEGGVAGPPARPPAAEREKWVTAPGPVAAPAQRRQLRRRPVEPHRGQPGGGTVTGTCRDSARPRPGERGCDWGVNGL